MFYACICCCFLVLVVFYILCCVYLVSVLCFYVLSVCFYCLIQLGYIFIVINVVPIPPGLYVSIFCMLFVFPNVFLAFASLLCCPMFSVPPYVFILCSLCLVFIGFIVFIVMHVAQPLFSFSVCVSLLFVLLFSMCFYVCYCGYMCYLGFSVVLLCVFCSFVLFMLYLLLLPMCCLFGFRVLCCFLCVCVCVCVLVCCFVYVSLGCYMLSILCALLF